MASFEALYGRSCRSSVCYDDSSDTVVVGPPLQEMIEQVQLIRKRIRAAQDRPKSYHTGLVDLLSTKSGIKFSFGFHQLE